MTLKTQRPLNFIGNETYDLVRGEFTPEEATEIVSALFSKKISFHELKIFSKKIRYGDQDEISEKRIHDLKIARQKATDLITQGKDTGKTIQLCAEIVIKLV